MLRGSMAMGVTTGFKKTHRLRHTRAVPSVGWHGLSWVLRQPISPRPVGVEPLDSRLQHTQRTRWSAGSKAVADLFRRMSGKEPNLDEPTAERVIIKIIPTQVSTPTLYGGRHDQRGAAFVESQEPPSQERG